MLTHHIRHYLRFIDSGINTFCWMNADSTKVLSGRSCVHGKLKHVLSWHEELKREGEKLPTLHMALNETDLTGRRTPNIKAYRVICCDVDRKISEKDLLHLYKTYKAQMVVRSSEGKYHFYWKLERGSDLDVWRKIQLAIAHKMGGDLQLSLPTSMIRVPGLPRLDKEGNQILPSVLTFPEGENEVKALSIKELLRLWPWLWEASEEGEKELKRQRSEAAKIARELLKARGTSYDAQKFARLTPDAGRNTTLYLTLYDIVYTTEEDLSYEDALSYAEEVNNAFSAPLGQTEVQKTVRSAFEHAKRARAAKAREQRTLIKALETSGAVKEKDQRKEQAAELGKLITETILGTEAAHVPDSFLEISDILISRLWLRCDDKQQAANHNILGSAARTRYYKKLTDFMVEQLKTCGAFRVSGYSTYLRGVNESGHIVRYRKNLDVDSTASLVHDVLSRLYLYAVKVSLNGGGKVVERNVMAHLSEEEPNGSSGSREDQKEEKVKSKKNKARKASNILRNKANGRGHHKENAP
jgi:hypothetical protein